MAKVNITVLYQKIIHPKLKPMLEYNTTVIPRLEKNLDIKELSIIVPDSMQKYG